MKPNQGLKAIFAGEFRLAADDGTPMGTLVARIAADSTLPTIGSRL